MKKFKNPLPNGVMCTIILCVLFGYMATVMGLTNMLNSMMKTAHDLLINTVFYLMGMCVLTGALGKILINFGVVNLLQKMLKPVMRPLFNMPGVASLGAVLTFLSDNPAIIALTKDKGFARYFKKYQHVSLVNFGTAFGMGLLVIIFMMGQGYYKEPFIGFFGAMCGCVIATRLMQYFTVKDFPNYKYESAVSDEEIAALEAEEAEKAAQQEGKDEESTFIRVLNALLDGGKEGVEIGLAIIPGVVIISTLVMMFTFGGSVEGQDAAGHDIIVYTGGAYEGTQLLPWLASKISFVFEWLFGFTAPELVAFPITALGAVGAALGLIPEFAAKGIIDGNAIAVCTAMGMCWSGYLSTDAATLDSLGYRPLVPRAFLSTFLGGIAAGIITHWTYVGIIALSSVFAPKPVWTAEINTWTGTEEKAVVSTITMQDDSTYVMKGLCGNKDAELLFAVNAKDSTMVITNQYAKKGDYSFVYINEKATSEKDIHHISLYTTTDYSEFVGTQKEGYFWVFIWMYDCKNRPVGGGYLEATWGGHKRETTEEVIEQIEKEVEERIDSFNVAKETASPSPAEGEAPQNTEGAK